MSNEEIALRLTEAWANQEGIPASINEILSNYYYVLKSIKEGTE